MNGSNLFTFDWDAPLADDERDELLRKIADSIRRRGLQTPAIWMLEIHRPLAPLGGQMAIAISPFLGAFFGGGAHDLQRYTQLMRGPGNVERLIALLESEDLASAAPPTTLESSTAAP